MLVARSSITVQSVAVQRVIVAILSEDVLKLFESQKYQRSEILVFQVLVDLTQCAELTTIVQFVNAKLVILEIHQTAAQNVVSTRTVLTTKYATIIDVSIHALEYAVKMLSAKSSPMLFHVHVLKDILEMLSFNAFHKQFYMNLWIHVSHLHVDQMLNA